jgi:hypothetical protein
MLRRKAGEGSREDSHMNYMMIAFALAMGAMVAAAPGSAAGFGFTAGPPVEERMGSEYGAEYYHRNSRVAPHCRTIRVKTPSGVQRLRRCKREQ